MRKGAANTVLEVADGPGGLEVANEDLRIVNQVQAEDVLQHERGFAESLITTAQAIVLVLDTEGRIIRFNPYMEEISGYRLEEVRGKDWFTIFLPKSDQSGMRALFLKAVGDIRTRGNVNLIVTKDGRKREIEWYDKTLKDSDGNVVGLLSIGHDITERKQAEDSLRESEQRLREAQKIARIGRWDLDLISNRLQWSDSIFELFEIDPRKFKASYEAFLDAIHPADRNKVDIAYTESLKNKLPYEISHRLLMKDGRIKWVHEMCRTEYDSQGQALRSVGIVQDITERKQAEDALRRIEERLSSFMNSASDSFYLLDADLNFVEINERGLAIIGKNREDVIGKNITEIVPDVKESGRYEKHLEVIRTGQPFVIDHFIPHPVFGDLDFMLKSFKVGDGLGVIATDITERKQAEEELQKRMNELETFYRTTLGREERVIELKQEVNQLLEQLGKNKKYGDYSKE
jgi:PAS domain S-box-containing protein